MSPCHTEGFPVPGAFAGRRLAQPASLAPHTACYPREAAIKNMALKTAKPKPKSQEMQKKTQ